MHSLDFNPKILHSSTRMINCKVIFEVILYKSQYCKYSHNNDIIDWVHNHTFYFLIFKLFAKKFDTRKLSIAQWNSNAKKMNGIIDLKDKSI